MEYGEAAAAGPDGRRPPHHVVADHALHRAAGELVLDLLHQLRHRPVGPSLAGSGGGPLRWRAVAMVSCVAVLLLRRGGAAIVPVVAVIGAAVARAGLRGGRRDGQDRGGAVGGGSGVAGAPHAGGGGHGSTPAAAIRGGRHTVTAADSGGRRGSVRCGRGRRRPGRHAGYIGSRSTRGSQVGLPFSTPSSVHLHVLGKKVLLFFFLKKNIQKI